MEPSASRRTFLRHAAAWGLTAPLLAGCGHEERRASPAARPSDGEPAAPVTSLGPELRQAGLLALAAAHTRRWNQGHHGAAVIAACYFCEEARLDEAAAAALRAQVEAFMRSRRGAFADLAPGTGRADPGRIVAQLAEHVDTLRSGGHDAIYASLALRVLRDMPELATPRVVDGVCALLQTFVRTVPAQPPSRYEREHPLPPYEDTRDLARRTLHALLRPWSHVASVGTGNVVHWITHGDALVTLEELGHADVARKGHAAHLQYVNEEVGPAGEPAPARPAIAWRDAAYWASDAPRRPQKGTWFFGHSFKLPYSLFRLMDRADDAQLGARALARASLLAVPFA